MVMSLWKWHKLTHIYLFFFPVVFLLFIFIFVCDTGQISDVQQSSCFFFFCVIVVIIILLFTFFCLFVCHLKTHTPCDNLTFGITEMTSLDPIAFFFIFLFIFFFSLVVWTVSRLSSKPKRTPLFSLCADFGWAKTVYIFYTRVCLPFRFSLLFAFFLCFPFLFCKSRFFFPVVFPTSLFRRPHPHFMCANMRWLLSTGKLRRGMWAALEEQAHLSLITCSQARFFYKLGTHVSLHRKLF